MRLAILFTLLTWSGIYAGSCGISYTNYSYSHPSNYSYSYPSNYSYSYPVNYQKTVVKEYLVPVATFVPIGLYTSSYMPTNHSTGSPANSCTEEVKKLKEEIDALKASLKSSPVSARISDNSNDVVSILKTSCASCHTGQSREGGGFKIFEPNGQLTSLNDRASRKIVTMVYTEQMPPGNPLDRNKTDKIARHFDSN